MNYATAPLSRLERWHLLSFLGLMLLFGGIVEMRSAFLERRMSDLTVFIRAGWAVRSGENIYRVSDEGNGWYYVYPPLFAIAMAPLAEAPPGHDQSGLIPYPISVAIWYLISLALLFWGAHRLASALERTSTDPDIRGQPTGCRRWWALRIMPIYACIIPAGATLSHGQTNLLILAMLCGMFAALVEKKTFQAGLWMAGPICMKVFPAFLLIYPLWRRDWRCLAGCTLGLILGLALIPGIVFGPERTIYYYQEFADLVLFPGIGTGNNQARADTLTAITATDTQSFMGMIHNTMYPDVYQRPHHPASWVRATHWGLGAILTAAVCLAAGWRRPSQPIADVLFMGLLVMLMMFVSPVCHLPYFCWLLPIFSGLFLLRWEQRRDVSLGYGWWTNLSVNFVIHMFAQMYEYQALKIFRDMGFATYVALVFFGIALTQMWRLRATSQPVVVEVESEARLAA